MKENVLPRDSEIILLFFFSSGAKMTPDAVYKYYHQLCKVLILILCVCICVCVVSINIKRLFCMNMIVYNKLYLIPPTLKYCYVVPLGGMSVMVFQLIRMASSGRITRTADST